VVYSFSILLNFVFGYETNIAEIGAQQKFHIMAKCINERKTGKS